MTPYHFSKIVDLTFDVAVAAISKTLSNHGFGVLTDIVPSRRWAPVFDKS